ncbi:MAG: hypothetical protein ACLPJY_05115 [Rhodomicrobium sp.]
MATTASLRRASTAIIRWTANSAVSCCLILGSLAGNALAQNTMGNIFGNQGIITQGQSGNNTIIQGPIPRHLSDPRADSLKIQILREIPKDKPITVMALMNDAEAIEFAQEIHTFMKNNGFQMKEPDGISQGAFSGPVKGLQKRDEKDGSITFIIGANLQ